MAHKPIPVIDDHSRKLLACPLLSDESGQSTSGAIEIARETAQSEGHVVDTRPTLVTDSGAGFSGEMPAKHLKARGVPHIFGAPYHPQTQGKVERFSRTLVKERGNLWVHGTPDDLRAAIGKENEGYDERPHEAVKNVCLSDVYAGRQEEVLAAGFGVESSLHHNRRRCVQGS